MARLNDYIKKIAGGEVEMPVPQNDLEKSLASIAENGGGGGGGLFVVTLTEDDTDPENPTFNADKTYEQVLAAWAMGEPIYVYYPPLEAYCPAVAEVGATDIQLYATHISIELAAADLGDLVVTSVMVRFASGEANVYLTEGNAQINITNAIPPFEE